MKDEIREFIGGRFDFEFDGDDVNDDTDLFENGLIDSLESLVLINFIEKNYKIKITPDDLVENPINSVNQIASFIKLKGIL